MKSLLSVLGPQTWGSCIIYVPAVRRQGRRFLYLGL